MSENGIQKKRFTPPPTVDVKKPQTAGEVFENPQAKGRIGLIFLPDGKVVKLLDGAIGLREIRALQMVAAELLAHSIQIIEQQEQAQQLAEHEAALNSIPMNFPVRN